MSEIIRSWLQDRLGLLFDKQSWEEDRGGGVLATLLNSYTLLTDEQLQIIFSKEGPLYAPTLEVMRLVITNLGIHLDKQEFEDVLDAKGTAVNRLFYELFLALQNKDVADIVLYRKLKEPIQKSRFTVSTHDAESVSEEIEVEKFNNPLAACLQGKDEVVTYHINKYLDLMSKCKAARENYMNFLANRRPMGGSKVRSQPPTAVAESATPQLEVGELPTDAASLNQSITELMNEQKCAEKMGRMVCDERVAKRIISGIQERARRANKNRGLRGAYCKKILTRLWDELMQEQEEYFQNQFVEKLQQQSSYEQQIVMCLVNVREQRHEMIEQKRALMEEVRKACEEEIKYKMFDAEYKDDKIRFNYYLEKKKKLMMHRKLLERKKARAQGRSQDECKAIVKDLVDMALYIAEYNEVNSGPFPRRKRDDLARLFIARKPIFDLMQDVTEVIRPPQEYFSSTSEEEEEEEEEDAEPITILELDRQNALDDLTFEDYDNFKWPWDYNSWMEYPECTDMLLGANVVGHVIHRILLGKYPRKAVLNATPVPRTAIAACVDGLLNLNYLPALEQLLRARHVKVIHIPDAFDYCLGVFRQESTEEYFTGVFDLATEAVLKEKAGRTKVPDKKGSKKGGRKENTNSESKKSGRDKKSKKSKGTVEEEDEEGQVAAPAFEDKINQTPNLFPGEELVLSAAGKVGKSLFEVMNLGGVPDEYLNASAFVEYLKSLNFEEMAGWVLINYPKTIHQAIALEECLSCTKIPFNLTALRPDSVEDLVDIPQRPAIDGTRWRLSSSKLFPNPKSHLDDELDYDTFLTAFIEMRTENKDDPDEQITDCFRCPENTQALCQFYQDQGCKYTLYYETIDFNAIKQLGKLILGDYSLPPKDSETLFTDTVHYVEANFAELTQGKTAVVKEGEKSAKKHTKKAEAKAGDRGREVEKPKEKGAKKDKESKKEKKGKKDKDKASDRESKKHKEPKGKKDKKTKDKRSTAEVEMEDEETQIPTPVPELAEPEEPSLPPPVPGEYRWIYHDLPILPYYEEALATMWENIEEIYVTDMKQLFFRRRVTMDALVLYTSYVRDNYLEFLMRPDTKQTHLTEFQLVYNELEDDMREDDEVKDELHMRIEEFREKLFKICDCRMLENEAERVRVIQENWVTTQLIELCNIYTTFVQLEVDRSTDTCQMLVDYYSAMITGGPCGKDVLEKITLSNIPLPTNLEDLDHIAPFVEFTEHAMQKVDKKKVRENLDADVEVKVSAKDNPFVHKIKVTLDAANNRIESNLNDCKAVCDGLSARFNPKAAKVRGKPLKHEKKDKKANKSEDKGSTVASEPVIVEPEEDAKRHAGDLLRELETAYLGECYRCTLRLKILEHAFEEEMQDMLDKSGGSFQGLYKLIEQRYKGEIHAVEQAIKLLQRAVEEETGIQPEMLLENDMFYVKIGSLMYESPLPDVDDVPVQEPSDDEMFTIAQLTRITDVLHSLAPTGTIPERAFAFLLQEFLIYSGEDGEEDFVPKGWKKLPPHKVQQLMKKLFGETEYIDWKDFIIYALGVRFPSEVELMQTRRQFRVLDPDMTEFIYDHQYPQVTFWFEPDVQPQRLKEMRALLYRLFTINTRLNYTALLLAFCKDTDPVVGFIKALEVSMGVIIIYDESRGSLKYVRSLKRIMARELDNITRQREHAEMQVFSKEILEKLVDDTIHTTNRVVIEAVNSEQLQPLCSYDIIQYLHGPSCSGNASSADFENEHVENVTEGFINMGSQGHVAREPGEHQVAFDVLLNIFTVTIPWLHKIKRFGELSFHERLAMLYNSLINEDVRIAYVYQIVNNPEFLKMFRTFYKFYDRRLVEIVRKLLEEEALSSCN